MPGSDAASPMAVKDNSQEKSSRAKGTGVFISSLYLQQQAEPEQQDTPGSGDTSDVEENNGTKPCAKPGSMGVQRASVIYTGPVACEAGRVGAASGRSAPIPPPPPPPPPHTYLCNGSNRPSIEVIHPFAAAASTAPSARSSLDSMSCASLQGQQQRSSMEVGSRRGSTVLIVPDWEHSPAAFEAARFDVYGNCVASPAAAGSMWGRGQSYAAASVPAQQQQLLLSPAAQTPPASFTGGQMYQQQQQRQQVTAQRAATAPLPVLVCAAATGNQALQVPPPPQQQQILVMSSPMPSSEYMYNDDCAPSLNGQHMSAIAAGPGMRRSFCLEQHQLSAAAAASRPRPASFTSDIRFNQQQQQLQQLVIVSDGQQLIGAPPGSNLLSSPLPMLLPQQQQQVLLCQDMGFSGQLPSAVLGPALDNAFTQGTALQEVPAAVMQAALQEVPAAVMQAALQQQQQMQAQQQQMMMALGVDAGRALSMPLPAMMEPQLLGSNQLLQQQQMCMPLGGAVVCSSGQLSTAGAQAAASSDLAAAQNQLQQLLLDSKLASQWQQNIQEELLQLLPMP